MSDDTRFDDVAHDYDATVQRAIGASGESVQFFAELKVQLMSRVLGEEQPATILDFGCGIGNTTRAIAARFPRSRVIGFDVSAESIAIARQISTESDRIAYISTTEPRLPLADGSIAAAFTSCVFHHIEERDREHWASELRRVLEPHAPLFLFEHNPYNPLTVRVVRRVPFDEGVILLTPAVATDLLQRAGFITQSPWFYFFFPAFLRVFRRIEPALKRIPLGAQYFVVAR
jgi:ubiquinone/menaquinone biosynthesis C-methylase UbiE